LTAALIEARPAIFLDNFNAKTVSSDILESAITENPCEVRLLGVSKMVRLFTKTFIAMTGNATTVGEDSVRRVIVISFDAKVENPEQRPFKPGFLDSIQENRATLLGHALTIWRWGRQNAASLKRGKPLGSFEQWAAWCRDPLLALGCRDPVDRVAEIKAADPKRKKIVSVFEAWRKEHGEKEIFAKDLDPSVIKLIDEKATFRDFELQYSRQYVADWLCRYTDTRIAGYTLTRVSEGPPSKPVHRYKLKYEPPKDEVAPKDDQAEPEPQLEYRFGAPRGEVLGDEIPF
jgi:hypothetical protein